MKNGVAVLAETFRRLWTLEELRPIRVSVMGQTGVGKTTLVNALFGTKFKESATCPETLEPQSYVENMGSYRLEFWDLPGLGEARAADERYSNIYRDKLLSSHVVVWAVHADSRSFRFDRTALEALIGSIPDHDEQVRVMSKIVFTLTKVDLLMPSPWILKKEGSCGRFTAHGETEKLLAEKERYFQDAFIAPFGHLLGAQVHRSGNFSVRDDYFDYDERTVYYKGWMTVLQLERLCKEYPDHQDLLNRLYSNYRVIPCSSRFGFNLDSLMEVIIDKLELQAAPSFKNSLGKRKRSLSGVSFSKARGFGNMVVLDGQNYYDLGKMDYSSDELGE